MICCLEHNPIVGWGEAAFIYEICVFCSSMDEAPQLTATQQGISPLSLRGRSNSNKRSCSPPHSKDGRSSVTDASHKHLSRVL